ncbi:MAG: class I SAM-dependent methyltransferase [Acidimicrobiia bacterium]
MTEASTKVHHPVFARIYARVGAAAEGKGAAEHRDEVLDGLSGRVIEVGAGTGLNFRHYPETVTHVVAVEPEPLLRKLATDEATCSPLSIEVVEGVADALPVDDGSFDAGVASLVLCSVPDQAGALAELFRVIRPGGELRFLEHVRATSPGFARFQRAADIVWPLLGGGCHSSRDTLTAIEEAGFVVERVCRFSFVPCVFAKPVAPHILGVARRPT